jgi:hypothetical protein
MALGLRSLNDLIYPSLDRATGTAVARAEAFHRLRPLCPEPRAVLSPTAGTLARRFWVLETGAGEGLLNLLGSISGVVV